MVDALGFDDSQLEHSRMNLSISNPVFLKNINHYFHTIEGFECCFRLRNEKRNNVIYNIYPIFSVGKRFMIFLCLTSL